MKSFAVIGLGRFGSAIARYIEDEGGEVIAIEMNPEKVKEFENEFASVVEADASDIDALKDLGVSDVDAAIVSIGTKMGASILITLLLKELNVPLIVVKAMSPIHGKVLKKLVEPIKDLPVIDVGCGNGHAGVLFKNYTGADTELMISKIAKPTNPNYRYIIFNAESSNFSFISGYEVVLINAFIDVINKPLLITKKILQKATKYIVLHRQEIIDGKTTITIEKSYGGADTYHSKINRQEFLDLLENEIKTQLSF